MSPSMARVSELLRRKGNDVLKIEGSETVFEALKMVVERNVGSILVTDGGKVVGIMTERDYLRKIAILGRTSHDTLVREIMTSPLVYVTPDTSVEECMAVMTERRIRHVPVFADGRELVGIVSIGDLVKSIIRNQRFVIDQLEHYIHG